MRRLKHLVLYTLLIVGVTLGVLAAAGQLSSTVQITTRTIPKPVTPAPSAIKCPAKDTTMQCVLRNQPPPPATAPPKPLPESTSSSSTSTSASSTALGPVIAHLQLAAFKSSLAVTPSTYGIDFGWSTISASGAKAIGAKFGASYFSLDSSKNWTAALVNAYHRAGLATVGVWETGATRATGSYTEGRQDALRARAQAAALGNTTRPILFAIDCDCSGPQVAAYFQGVHSILGPRDDAYGSYGALLWLSQRGLVGHENWQTYAWSGGRWLPASIAPLEQYLNGNAFDNDRALAAAYGQWPGPSAAKPSRYAIYPTQRFRFGHGIRASERNTIQTWDRAKCRTPARRAVCRSSRAHLQLLEGRLYRVAHHPLSRHKPTWGVDHRGARYQGISRRLKH